MRKKLLVVLGLASTLALSVALATGKAAAGAAVAESSQEAKRAAISVEGAAGHSGGMAYDCQKVQSQCLKKRSAAKAQPSDDQNVASSGFDCPKSADCPRADCDKSMCPKSLGKAKAAPSEKAVDRSGAETEI